MEKILTMIKLQKTMKGNYLIPIETTLEIIVPFMQKNNKKMDTEEDEIMTRLFDGLMDRMLLDNPKPVCVPTSSIKKINKIWKKYKND